MITLRAATPDDRDAVELVLASSYGTLLRAAYADQLAAALPFLIRARPELLACGTFYVAELGGDVVGCGGWTRTSPEGREPVPGEAHIRHVACDPAWVRHGIARAILDRCLMEARDGGVRLLRCQSTLAAVSFYTAMGFRKIADATLALPSGPLPMVLMQADLRNVREVGVR